MNNDRAALVPSPETETSAQWLPVFAQSLDYAPLVARFERRDGFITHPVETAMLYALIQRLCKPLTLEIGTFFVNTTRIMA